MPTARRETYDEHELIAIRASVYGTRHETNNRLSKQILDAN